MSGDTLVRLTVNGGVRSVRADIATTLLEVLRDQLHLTGAKRGCNQGLCGACTVLVEGQAVRGCLSLVLNLEDRAITTVEGLSAGGKLTALQHNFIETGAVQCGFCTSGMLISAQALLSANPAPSEAAVREALSGNLCRCSGYAKIIIAVRRCAERGQ